MRPALPILALLCVSSLVGCADDDGPGAVSIGARHYGGAELEARLFRRGAGFDLRMQLKKDPIESRQDDEVTVRVDLVLAALEAGREYDFVQEVRLEFLLDYGVLPLDEAMPCTVQEDLLEAESDPVRLACVDAAWILSTEVPIIERVGGVVRIDRVSERELAGHVSLWAVGLEAADGEELLGQVHHPLFKGVTVDAPFAVRL